MNTIVIMLFSRTVAAVDTKRGYVGMCNGRSAQQESGAALSKRGGDSERRKRDAAAKRRKIANEDQEETVERRERDAAAKRRENSVFTAGAYNYIQLLY